MFWFEFLLNPSLLEEHLRKPSPDPSATELIIKFLAVAAGQKEAEKPETKNSDGEPKFCDVKNEVSFRVSKKVLALRLLSLKVAAFLKWDLTILETKLPLPMQVTLLQELLILCLNRSLVDDIMSCREERFGGPVGILGALAKEASVSSKEVTGAIKKESEVDGVIVFALSLCHRWAIRAIRLSRVPTKQTRTPYISVPGLQDAWYIAPNVVEEVMRGLEKLIPESIAVLEKIATLPKVHCPSAAVPLLPSYNSFNLPTEDSEDGALLHDWSKSMEISAQELHCQIHYDLGAYFFFQEKYSLAKEHIQAASELYSSLAGKTLSYCTVDEEVLQGYLSSCRLEPIRKIPSHTTPLLDQFFHSIKNMYMGMVSILQQDNLKKEIPLVHRDILELDIAGAATSGKFTVARDLLLQVQTLNMIRRVMGNSSATSDPHYFSTTGDYIESVKQRPAKAAELLIAALKQVQRQLSENQMKALKSMVMWVLEWGSEEIPEDLEEEEEGEEGEVMPDSDSKGGCILQRTLLSSSEVRYLFSDVELRHMDKRWRVCKFRKESHQMQLSEALDVTPWYKPTELTDGHTKLVSGRLEQQLILSYSPDEIRQHIHSLLAINSAKSLTRINLKWELPVAVNSAVMSIPRGFLQDFSFILMAKARELTEMKDYEGAVSLLTVVHGELHQHGGAGSSITIHKLIRVVSWEILFVQILQSLEQWPLIENPQELVVKCKACLSVVCSTANGSDVLPRLELAELCAACLLNLHDWDFLCSLDVRRCPNLDFPCAVAAASRHLLKFKGAKKLSRDTWDLVVPAFGPSSLLSSGPQGGASGGGGPHHHHHHHHHGGSGSSFHQHKRSSSGSTVSVVHRSSSPSGMSSSGSSAIGSLTRSQLSSWVERIKEGTILSVLASLLARLHNVLRDEPSLELNGEYVALWPAVLSNANSYHLRAVAEMLWQLLSQALDIYPINLGYLKLMGDLNFVMNHYAAAMKYYLEAAIIASDFFGQPIPRTVIDDSIFRRMIKCCTQLQCHTQAAVLCQFLEEVDYVTAFKSLGERGGSTADAADAHLASCVWDITLLEFLVHLHAKRGEIQRKQQAIKVIGLLELNSNNNEEIQREAANIRKARFLRAISRQYVM